MSCPVEYWIWLQRTLGAGFRADEAIAFFEDPRQMYEAGKREWVLSGALTSQSISRLSKFSPSQSYDVIANCSENGWTIVPYDSPLYPERLRHISSFPLVLYVWGDASVLNDDVCISIVGTRDCSDYGLDVASSLAAALAKGGATVVSGGAIGVDRAAHEGAMEADGKTVAFLGCGLGYDYLRTNGNLRKNIAHHGAVVSEFLPYSPASRITFPVRNRLISGLSLGTVVIEAGEKSGSLITAKTALEQGRDVFAIPGDVTSSNYFGTNNLLRDGAKPVFSAYDVLCEYCDMYPERIKIQGSDVQLCRKAGIPKAANEASPVRNGVKKKKTAAEKTKAADDVEKRQISMTDMQNEASLPSYVTDNGRKVYSCLSSEPGTADTLSEKSGLPISDVLSALTELEMYGCASLNSGNRWTKPNNT